MNTPMDGEFINTEIQEMQFLQALINSMMDDEESAIVDSLEYLIEYHHILYALLDKQHVIYTRMMMEDDEESKECARLLVEEANKVGKDRDMTMSEFYSVSKQEVKNNIEYYGGDTSELDIDVDWS